MRPWQRFTAVEYAKPSALPYEISNLSDISSSTARELLLRAGDLVRGILGLDICPRAINSSG